MPEIFDRVYVTTNDGLGVLGQIDAESGLAVRTNPIAPTGERYTINATANGISTFDSTADGDERYPMGYYNSFLYSKLEDLADAELALESGGYPFS